MYVWPSCCVVHRDGRGLDGDAALALEVHVVEDLVLGLSRAVIVPVSSSMRSASVLLPWSMWATIEKFRICCVSISGIYPNQDELELKDIGSERDISFARNRGCRPTSPAKSHSTESAIGRASSERRTRPAST